jgi:hypothetical protein
MPPAAHCRRLLSALRVDVGPLLEQPLDDLLVALELHQRETSSLRALTKSFASPRTAAYRTPSSYTGLGGVGKTQLALRFVKDHRDRYGPILWINAESPETVRASFERCAAALRLPVDKSSPPGPRQALKDWSAIESVLRWLGARDETDEEWLVVIDNADDVQLEHRGDHSSRTMRECYRYQSAPPI